MAEKLDPPAQTFLDELTADISSISSPDSARIAVFLLIGGVLGVYIRLLYDRYGRSTADTDSVSRSFPLLTIVTIGIITVIKSSLALSLGLVGALSIVRFRAAIKEPEELVYLFLCIAVGLCLGAEQLSIALLMVLVITAFALGNHFFSHGRRRHNVVLTITGRPELFTDASTGVLAAVGALSTRQWIQRFDVDDSEGQLRVLLAQQASDDTESIVRGLREKLPECRFSYVNMDGIL